jgi:hypothetical protein
MLKIKYIPFKQIPFIPFEVDRIVYVLLQHQLVRVVILTNGRGFEVPNNYDIGHAINIVNDYNTGKRVLITYKLSWWGIDENYTDGWLYDDDDEWC